MIHLSVITLALLSSVLVSTQAFAHVEKGDYKGLDQNGKACAFTIGEMWFEGEIEHPLTERIEVSKLVFEGFKPVLNQFQTGHPPVVNLESGLARFNHDIFQDIAATATGAVSVTILKQKEESKEGKPVGIIYIEDNYRNKNESKKITCLL